MHSPLLFISTLLTSLKNICLAIRVTTTHLHLPLIEHIQCNSQDQCQQVTTCADDPSIVVGLYVLLSLSLPLLDSSYILRTVTPIFSSSRTSRIPTVLPQNAITPALAIGINNKTQNTPLTRNIDLGKRRQSAKAHKRYPGARSALYLQYRDSRMVMVLGVCCRMRWKW